MKIKVLKKLVDVTVGKIYNAEFSDCKTRIIFCDDVGDRRHLYCPDYRNYIEVVDEPEQLTLRDQLAMAGIILFQNSDANYSFIAEELYKFADAAMEARKK